MLGETESGVTPVRRGKDRVEANGTQVGLTADLAFFWRMPFGRRQSGYGLRPRYRLTGVSNVNLCFIVVAVLAAAGLADAKVYVDENFEQSVPPPGWTSSKSGEGAGWDAEAGGPWGTYALGWASSSAGVERWAKMDTYSFTVPAEAKLAFRFDYKYGHGGYEAPNRATFALLYAAYPEQIFASHGMMLTSTWRGFEGTAVATRGGLVKVRFEVWVKNPHPRRVAIYAWDVDNVVVVDAGEYAVAPASLGRVRAVFK